MTGDPLGWLDEFGDDQLALLAKVAATITKLRSRQSAIDGGGLMLDPAVAMACERIRQLAAGRLGQGSRSTSSIGNDAADNATIAGWESPAVAADRLGVTGRRICQLAGTGQVTSRRFGRLLLIETASVDAYFRHRRKGSRRSA